MCACACGRVCWVVMIRHIFGNQNLPRMSLLYLCVLFRLLKAMCVLLKTCATYNSIQLNNVLRCILFCRTVLCILPKSTLNDILFRNMSSIYFWMLGENYLFVFGMACSARISTQTHIFSSERKPCSTRQYCNRNTNIHCISNSNKILYTFAAWNAYT